MRILVADDSCVVFERLVEMLASAPEAEIVGHTTDLPATLRSLAESCPDIVILDLCMPGGTGMDVLKSIRENGQETAAVVLTNFPYAQYRARCRSLGAVAFLDKSMQFDQVLGVIQDLESQRTPSVMR
jgi:DNA-binding NarL/FixJ family response regulator